MLRKLLLFLALAGSAFSQGITTSTARRVVTGSSLPATCAVGDIFFKTTATIGTYQCTSTNTWVAMGGGGGSVAWGGITGTLSDQTDLAAALVAKLPLAGGTMTGSLLFTDATYDIGASGATRPRDIFLSRDATVGRNLAVGTSFAANLPAISTPSAPTVTNQGTPGVESYSYAIKAVGATGGLTLLSASGTTDTGNATLDNTNFNRFTWPAVTGAVRYYVFRNGSSGDPSSQGFIGTATSPTFDDTGLTSDGSFGWIDAPNSTAGFFGGPSFGLPDTSNKQWSIYAGASPSSFSKEFFGFDQPYVQYFFGATPNGSAVNSLASFVNETTADAFGITLGAYGATRGSFGTLAFAAEGANTGSVTAANVFSVQSAIRIFGAGDITNAAEYIAQGVSQNGGSAAGVATNWYGYKASLADPTIVTNGYAFYSALNSRANQWAFYGAGTAASHFGGTLEVVSLQTTGAATGKKTVCVDTATGVLYASSTGTDCSN